MSNLDLDDESDVETPEVGSEHSSDITSMTSQIDQLRSMKRELDFRGTLLGKTWAELSQLLGKYQADLVTKYDHLESMLGSEGRDQIIKLENTVEHKSRQISELHKTIHDLETRLLEKDGEIVHLRTDVHKLRNEVSIKDNLINKVQTQMAKESMEYTTEINTLKEIISVGEGNMAPLDTVEIQPAPQPQPKRKRKSHGSSSGSAMELGPSSKTKKEMKESTSQPSPSIIKLPEAVDLARLPQITLAALPTLSPQIVLTTAPITGTPTIWPTAPRRTVPEPAVTDTAPETVQEKESLDLQLDITVEEEPSIKSESDDVMMALEQVETSAEEPGTSGTQTSLKSKRGGRTAVWKPEMTSEEREAYNRSARERMRRYRQRKKDKESRLETYINKLQCPSSNFMESLNNNNSVAGLKNVPNKPYYGHDGAMDLVTKKVGRDLMKSPDIFWKSAGDSVLGLMRESGIGLNNVWMPAAPSSGFDRSNPVDLTKEILKRPSMVPPMACPRPFSSSAEGLMKIPLQKNEKSLDRKTDGYLEPHKSLQSTESSLEIPECLKSPMKPEFQHLLRPYTIRSAVMPERMNVTAKHATTSSQISPSSSESLEKPPMNLESRDSMTLEDIHRLHLRGKSEEGVVRDLNRNITHVNKVSHNKRVYFP